MKITLPVRLDGQATQLDTNGNPIIVIGANGAGKSRFTRHLAESLADRAFTLSALDGLYGRGHAADLVSSVRSIYDSVSLPAADLPDAGSRTELDLLLTMLMHDEMINLIRFKLERAEGHDASLADTRLDKVISLWQEIFPDNHILIESGSFLFRRDNDSRHYSALRLSDGEKAVIYYIAGVLYAPADAVIFINSPEIFLNPSIMQSLWSSIEALRPDCTFVYTTHDLDFASTRINSAVIWVRNFDAASLRWDYVTLDSPTEIGDDTYKAIIGSRKPVLFIEGDGVHSIDSKLYPLIFKKFSVRSLGSCNKVIEATRTFNDINALHHLDSYGIVDRDRRDQHEVTYLRGKRIMVPEVAEIENILMLEEVIRAVARVHGRDVRRAFDRVRKAIISQFAQDLRQQALMHTRHRVKRLVEYRIDGRFTGIAMLEEHISRLNDEIQPRRIYEEFCREFRRYVDEGDYPAVLRVYNQKSMLASCNVAGLCGLKNKDEYIASVIDILRRELPDAKSIRTAVIKCFGLPEDEML